MVREEGRQTGYECRRNAGGTRRWAGTIRRQQKRPRQTKNALCEQAVELTHAVYLSQAGFIQGTKATLTGASEGDEALVSGNDVVAVNEKEGG